VLGQLNGIAHAGVYGNESAVIAASYMNPMQLRIANYISRAPDYESEGVYMECGYLDKENEKIAIDRLQILPQLKRELSAMERRMGEAIVITSGKGGVGKTTTSANLGTALALNEKSVCLIDTDIGLRNLDVIMGLENRIIYDIVDVIEERCQLKQALIKDKRFEALALLPAAQTSDKSAVTKEGIMKIIAELKEEYDY